MIVVSIPGTACIVTGAEPKECTRMTYAQWDAIADAVNPAMALVALLLPLLTRSAYRGGRVAFYAASASGLAAMYALGWLDARLHLWEAAGLDYSTHSGFAAVLVVSLWMWKRRAGAIATAVALAYVGLMLFQRYHTIADIASTTAVTVPLTLALHHICAAILVRASGTAPTAR